jgi:hypothetical protein
MKRLLILSIIVLLAGCSTAVPVQRHFPDVPADMKVACPDLKLIDPNTSKLSDLILVVSDNYEQYKECKIKIDAWIEWYNTQEKIFNSVK